MAFDPDREDYRRMSLRFARSLDTLSPAEAVHEINRFGRTFAQDRDELPQSDFDRAFHLVARAAHAIDYELPFSTDDDARRIIENAHTTLNEALKLDASCHDATRMLAAAQYPTFESYYAFLRDGAAEVYDCCLRAQKSATSDQNPERAQLASRLAISPYLRWISAEASKAVICGHNRIAIKLCNELLELDPQDMADARFTAAIAYAKLEDEQALDALEERCRPISVARGSQDAWLALSRIALAHKRHDLAGARQLVATMLHNWPHASDILFKQRELPDGVYARIAVPPGSEDELILALSEATVLLQEGRDRNGRGVLGTWLQDAVVSLDPKGIATLMKDPAAPTPPTAQDEGDGQ